MKEPTAGFTAKWLPTVYVTGKRYVLLRRALEVAAVPPELQQIHRDLLERLDQIGARMRYKADPWPE